MTGVTKRHGKSRIQLGRLAPTLARWLKAERVGTVGLTVLLAAALLAAGLAIHGYDNRGLALTSVSASTPSQGSSRQLAGPAKSGPAKSASGSTPSTTSPPPKLGPALSSTQYAQYSYRLYPGPVGASAQQATAGYSISTKVSGSNVVLLVSTAGSSKPLSRKTYPAADTIYFIEANFGDDSGATELNPGDDGLVVTNPQGLIVEG
jgi:hypothetical protein